MGERDLQSVRPTPWRVGDGSSRLLLDIAAGRSITLDRAPTEEETSLAARHGLLGLMADHDNQYLRSAALAPYARLAARQQVMNHHLRRVLEELHGAGVRASVLKGSHLAHWAYRNPAHRTTTDIDLLVPASDVDRALGVLEGDAAIATIPPKTPKADKRNIPMADPSGVRFTLDLHWDLFSYSQLRGSAAGATGWAWNHADFVASHPLGPLWELPLEARIAFLTTHALLDHRFRLILFRDLTEVCELDLDWERVTEFCGRWGLAFALHHALSIARHAVDARVPEFVLEARSSSGLAGRLVTNLLPRTDLVRFDGHTVHALNLALVLSHDRLGVRSRLAASAPLAFRQWRDRVGTVDGAPRRRHSPPLPVARRPLVVHLLPLDLARGAQTYAQAVRARLDGDGGTHRTMTLFEAPGAVLDADIALGAPARLRRFGLDPGAVVRLLRELRHMAPDVVVAHGGESLKYVALTAPRTARLVYLKIGTSRRHLRNPLRRLLYSVVLRRFDRVVGVSQEMVAEAREILHVPEDRLVYVPNGRDPEPFVLAEHDDHRPVRLCFVGHLTRTKRPEVFIELVRELRSRGLPCIGVMAGDGPLLPRLVDEAAAAGVEVLGRSDDIPQLLGKVDVFVFSSLVEGEGMPGVLIEAGLAGLPVVATDVPGARTVIVDGVTGYVVPVDDFEMMLATTARLVEEPDRRRRLGTAARERCLEHFTLEASAARFREVLDGTLQGAPVGLRR